jgi:hypothetical protein
MWDKSDTFTRSYQAIFGVVIFFGSVSLAAFALKTLGQSMLFHRFGVMAAGLSIVGFYVSFRCLWYAVTGEDNINRDDF